MFFTGLTLRKVGAQFNFKPFDCGDHDLNEFLQLKAEYYKKELLATTYVLENEDRTLAFFVFLTTVFRRTRKNSHQKMRLKNF